MPCLDPQKLPWKSKENTHTFSFLNLIPPFFFAITGGLDGNCFWVCFSDSNFTIFPGTKWEMKKFVGFSFSSQFYRFSLELRRKGKENAYGFLILRLSQWKENGYGLFILRLIVPRPPPFVIFSFDIHGKWKENAFRFFLLKPISPFPPSNNVGCVSLFQANLTIFLPFFCLSTFLFKILKVATDYLRREFSLIVFTR